MKKIYTTVSIAFLLLLSVSLTQAQNGYFGHYFQHQCRDTNQIYNYTWLYDSLLNEDSNALAIFTPHALMSGLVEDFHCGLWYNKNIKRWTIYSEQGGTDTMPIYSGYNVLVPSTNGSMLKHTANASNITGNKTLIDEPATNSNPNALLYISHNWGVTGGTYNNHAVGVYYDQAEAKWGIFNEDLSPFPTGAVYNVFVVDAANANAFIHTSGVAPSASPYLTMLDYPSLTENYDASILVTHNLSPNGVTNNKYDTATVAIGFKSIDWLIYNRTKSPMDSGTTFNVLIANTLPPSAINETPASAFDFRVFPNPAGNNISIAQSYPAATRVVISNTLGQQVATFDLTQQSSSFNISALASGIYHLSLWNKEQRLAAQMIVKD